MKKIFLYSVALLTAGSLMFTSCVDDLNTKPLSPNVITADVAFAAPESYAQYANYAYAYFSFVSQGDPGSSDIAVDNAGQSEYIRQYMALNELAADSFQIIDAWSDDYVKPLQYGYWNGTNAAVMAVYLRGLKAIAMCNQFLDPAVSGDAAVTARGHESVLDDVRAYRSELRLLRALHQSILMDLFGNPPVVTLESLQSGSLPKQMGRDKLFTWIETELKELVNDPNLSDTPIAYPRLSKGAAWAILARLYLNAEVYTGTARWSDAKTAAEKVITEGGYELCGNYKHLFMQDNTTNGAQKEFIIAAMYDTQTTPSYGGTTHLAVATVNETLKTKAHELLGLANPIYNGSWNGYHVSDDFVMKNFDLKGVNWENNGDAITWGYDVAASDQRAAFCNYKMSKDFTNETSELNNGWFCLKWMPITTDNRSYMIEQGNDFSSADFPIYRLAEMYLISAEAEARINGGTLSSTDAGYQRIKAIRQRANGTDDVMPMTLDLDYILKERARELYWEGHRRTDLIRYGYFLSATYPWPNKGGIANGVATLDSHRTVYPIISSDMITNGALDQNEGYPHH
ncbi:MAG: RagB/SusD family nutrient uptake outer membrane protein [Alistipes sp.]|nr:RagB/SusD family nutrient uptake outer membrane protein [Alistipes sp.]